MTKPHAEETSRRTFLQTSAAAVATTTLLELAPAVHAGGSGAFKVGLIGCGGRGTGAAEQACTAGDDVRLVAMADMFRDRLDEKREILRSSLGSKFAVKDENCFVGFDAYKGVLQSGVDVVLLTTPPHFRPMHLKAAIDAGKHVFAEKPVAVDATGARKVLAACEEARKKNLAVGSGLCWRYHEGMRETFQQIHGGKIGDIVAMQATYNMGMLWCRTLKEKQEKGWSDMEWQLRNWLYFTWLSGDHIVEQHVHSLDKMAWAMKNEYPVKATGMGGRQVRTAPDYGHIFDHHSVVFEFASGVKLFSQCRQQPGVATDVSDNIMGSKGMCHINAVEGTSKITGPEPWEYKSSRARKQNMYQNEHNELFASLRSGAPINNGEWMTKSTLMAIMGRMATYTGQVVTWDALLNSKEDLTPPRYEFGSLPMPPVAMPGVTKLT
jgi:predicted dehydrogenase